MKSCFFALVLGLATTGVYPSLHAQTEPSVQADGVVVQNGLRFLEVYAFSRIPFVSADGQYGAETADEVAMYEKLGMTYRYIEHDGLRRQLALPPEQGLFVETVDTQGEGHAAGFREGDLLLTVDGTPVDTQYDFVGLLAQKRGAEVTVHLRRNGQAMDLAFRGSEAAAAARDVYVVGVHVAATDELVNTQLGIPGGALVTAVIDNSAAKAAGIQEGDIIVQAGELIVREPADLARAVQKTGGSTVEITLLRSGNRMTVTVRPTAIQAGGAAAPAPPDFVMQSLLQTAIPQPRYPAIQRLVELSGQADDNTVSPTASVEERLTNLEQKVEAIYRLLQQQQAR